MLNPESDVDSSMLLDEELPQIDSRFSVYSSAVATFYAPSDMSGICGMSKERIHSTRSWRNEGARRDCIFAEKDSTPGFEGLHAARVLLFFSFSHLGVIYPCALVSWFTPLGTEPCEDTCMWIVEPELDMDGAPAICVIHLDSILRGAHLIPVYGDDLLPPDKVKHTNLLDLFTAYYVNKFADHHTHEIAF